MSLFIIVPAKRETVSNVTSDTLPIAKCVSTLVTVDEEFTSDPAIAELVSLDVIAPPKVIQHIFI